MGTPRARLGGLHPGWITLVPCGDDARHRHPQLDPVQRGGSERMRAGKLTGADHLPETRRHGASESQPASQMPRSREGASGEEVGLLRAMAGTLRQRATFNLRRNAGLQIGVVVVAPLAVLPLALSAPLWISLACAAGSVLAALLLATAGRVVQVHGASVDRARGAESAARASHQLEADERLRLEALQEAADVELELAQQVNQSLIPQGVSIEGVDLAVRFVPCAYIGGDYLHVGRPRPELLYLCVGDVSGHGPSAALVVSRLHGLVERMVLELRSPEAILGALHAAAARVLVHTSAFLTFGVFLVRLQEGTVEYATGGHPAQILLHADGSIERLLTPNGLMGTSIPSIFSAPVAQRVKLSPGDSLVLFTDGLFEVAPAAGGDVLGEEALARLVVREIRGESGAGADAVLRAVGDWRGHGEFADDVSLMVMRYGPPAPRSGPG
jgi:phosphoserine phosphatase RsbU/P